MNLNVTLNHFKHVYFELYFLRKKEEVEKALIGCIEVPFMVQQKAHKLLPLLLKLSPIFNLDTKSDLLVGVKCLETGIYGAYQNVLINLTGYDGKNEKVLF